MSSVQNTAPFVSGPVTLPSTLEVVGATTLDSTLEVKGAATVDGNATVVGKSTLDNGAITTNGSGALTIPGGSVYTGGGVFLTAPTAQIVVRNNGAGSSWAMFFPSLAAARSITWSDPGLSSQVNPIVSQTAAGQSITGGLTIDTLTLTNSLQFSIGAGILQSIAFTLTNTDIGNLTTGITVLNAPGAGLLLAPVNFVMEYFYDGTHSISGGTGFLCLCYNGNTTNLATSQVTETNFITGITANTVANPLNSFGTAASCIVASACVNQSLVLKKTGTAITLNGSTGFIRCRLWYLTYSSL